MLTADEAFELISYDPATGLFRWKKSHSKRIWPGKQAGSTASDGYVHIGLANKVYKAHRLAWLLMTGLWPKEQVDHINGNRSDNRWVNLRQVSNLENARNRSASRNNKSGVTGVYWDKQRSKWRARIKVGEKKIELGAFSDIREAERARKNAEVNFGFHPNHGRNKK